MYVQIGLSVHVSLTSPVPFTSIKSVESQKDRRREELHLVHDVHFQKLPPSRISQI